MRLSVSCILHLYVTVIEVGVVADGNIAMILCRFLGKMLNRREILYISFDRCRRICSAPHTGHMLDPVIMDREYEAQTAGSMTRSEQNTNPVVAERDHITIIDIVVDVEILPCIRPVREKWIFRPKIVVDFTEIGFAAKTIALNISSLG